MFGGFTNTILSRTTPQESKKTATAGMCPSGRLDNIDKGEPGVNKSQSMTSTVPLSMIQSIPVYDELSS